MVMAYRLMAPGTNVYFSWLRFCDINMISEVRKLLFCMIRLKSILLELLPHIQEASDIMIQEIKL